MKAIIIGSGIGGLATAALLAKSGVDVHVYEKNECVGGRGGIFEAQGFRFDMGPSWYLMPDIFEEFYQLLGENIADHLDLRRLDPAYKIWWNGEDIPPTVISSDIEKDMDTFEAFEPGVTPKLQAYLDKAQQKYEISKDDFMVRNYDSLRDLFNWKTATLGLKLGVFSSLNAHISRYIKDEHIQKIMQYPMLFLGSSPYHVPAIYSMMSHIDFNMGVWYPIGGMHAVMASMAAIAEKNGATIHLNSEVDRIMVEDGKATGVRLKDGTFSSADIVVSNADYQFTEQHLLEPKDQSYTAEYWKGVTMAPSGLILYLGIKGKCEHLEHHNLVFAKDWKKGFDALFTDPKYPDDISLYVCAPSKTEPETAPDGHENLFVLVPISTDLPDTPAVRQEQIDRVLETIETTLPIPDLRERIVYQKSFSITDFADRYNAYKGTALGFAHTLMQTAYFRPNTVSKKVSNLYFVGAGTNPGIGVPISLVSSQLVYKRLIGDTSGGMLTALQSIN